MTDPVEKIVAAAFDAVGISYVRNQDTDNGCRIDFYLPDRDLWIECCRYHSERKIRQMDTLPNAILVQGIDAARELAKWIGAGSALTMPPED